MVRPRRKQVKTDARVVISETRCSVCLEYCTSRACECEAGFMHMQCAWKYTAQLGSNCKVCHRTLQIDNLCERVHDPREAYMCASQRRYIGRTACKARQGLQWIRRVAPSVATIFRAHNRDANESPSLTYDFEVVMLTLMHSGEDVHHALLEILGQSDAALIYELAANATEGKRV